MAHYVIGDIQGCFNTLQTLLAKVEFAPGKDTLWLTGDLVNRGPQSLETLRFVKQHDNAIQTVLGNHDLHLIALAYGYGKPKKNDTLQPILTSSDCMTLIDWLRHQPLLIHNQSHLLVHAGLWPEWSVTTAYQRAHELEQILHSPNPSEFLVSMYGNSPVIDVASSSIEYHRFTVNVMTRMRAITRQGELNFDFKSTLSDMPKSLQPWFATKNRQSIDYTVVFGHWSALGLYQGHNVIGLDTGAIWGGKLTAINLDNNEIIQVAGLSKSTKR